MSFSHTRSAQTFHIPVMGTGFTIDTPLKVARYGISSVISLVDDHLTEDMRKFHCGLSGEPYEEIKSSSEDSRARRITAYLDLVDLLVSRQVLALQGSAFEVGSEITRYFELCPEGRTLDLYREMLACEDIEERARLEDALRLVAVPGRIEVNIMAKSDREHYLRGKKLPQEFSDANAALRGFANSTLRSSIVLSAGFNPRLYSYVSKFGDFFPVAGKAPKKEVVLKVSDYRSARIQSKFLAKRGVWVSEYRIESGLNCGGHVFPSVGQLMGPILDAFRANKRELFDGAFKAYAKSLASKGIALPETLGPSRLTVQGGIGTAEEDRFLRAYYEVDGTGWATPFMLVPEVVNMDDEHLEKIKNARADDVHLSDNSPFGLRFWSLRESASVLAQRERVVQGNPGSKCPSGFVRFNTEFSEIPICRASKVYQKKKLAQIEETVYDEEQRDYLVKSVLAKCCICTELAGAATKKHGINPAIATAVCCGPNIVNFSKIATLEEMVSHIYGKLSLLTNADRPHMFIRELALYVEYLRDELKEFSLELSTQSPKYFSEFAENLLGGIDYYRARAQEIVAQKQDRFVGELERLRGVIEGMVSVPVA